MNVLTRVILIVLIKLMLGVEYLRDTFPIEYASDDLSQDLNEVDDIFICFLLLLAQRLFHRPGNADIHDLIRRAVRSRTGSGSSSSITITSADLEQARYIDIRNQAYEEALEHCDVFGCQNANSHVAIPIALRDQREATAYLSGWYEGTSDALDIPDGSDDDLSDDEDEEDEEDEQDEKEEEQVMKPVDIGADDEDEAVGEEAVESNVDETRDVTDSTAGLSGRAALQYPIQENVTVVDAAATQSDAHTPPTKSAASPSAPRRKRPAPPDSTGRKQSSSGKQQKDSGTGGNDKAEDEDEEGE